MFETVSLRPPSDDGIPLVTRARNQIKNSIAPQPGSENFSRWGRIVAEHPSWEIRKAPVGGYNCAGHIWASRRTAIYDDEGEINQIRDEDEFQKIPEATVTPGDLVIYFLKRAAGPSFLHVGEVVEIPKGNPRFPRVLSKIDDWGGEIVHSLLDCPKTWGSPQRDFFWEFWREK